MSIAGKKFLFVSQYAGFTGGIERWMWRSARLLRQRGAEVWGCFLEPTRDPDLFLTGFDGCYSRRTLPKDFDCALAHKVNDLKVLRDANEYLSCGLSLFVHDHDCYCPRHHKYFPNRKNCSLPYSKLRCGFCGMAASPRGWEHGVVSELMEKFIRFPARFRYLREIKKFGVLSEFMRDNLVSNGFDASRIRLVPPYVPMPPPLELPTRSSSEPTLLFAGQLIRGKGCDLFLRLLPLLKQPWHARIAGDGKDMAMLRGLCAELKLDSKVEFAGWSHDPSVEYRAADIAVFPFRWQEPFGLVLAESAAHGLPVAAFDIGGARESVTDGVTGFLTPPGDLPALAERIDRLLADRALRIRLGSAGRELVAERFTQERFLTAFETLLND